MRRKIFVGPIAELAKAAGVSPSTMRRRIKSGAVQAIRLDDRCIRCAREKKRVSCAGCELVD